MALSVATLAAGAFVIVGVTILAPYLKDDLGLGPAGVGAIATSGYFGALVTSRRAGRLSDRFGPERMIAVGLVLMAAGAGLTALAPVPALFYAAVLLLGFGYGTINPATSVLSNPRSPRRRALAMSIKQSGVPVGGVAAGIALPALAESLGWRSAMALAGALCLLIAAWAGVAGARRIRTHAAVVVRPAAIAEQPLEEGSRLRLPHGLGYGLLMGGTQIALFSMLTTYLVEGRDLAPQAAGLGASALLLGGILGRPVWGILSDARPGRRVEMLQVVALVGALGVTAMVVVPGWSLLPVLVGVGVGAAGWNGVYIAAIAEAAPGQVGAAAGAGLMLINVGAVTIPLLVGIVVQQVDSWPAAWMVGATLCLLAAIGLAWARVTPHGPRRAGVLNEEPA
ncbi:MFS transporter [Nocardioides marmotae]|uniref:MFS transporter n=1 Tax=Nocardioides marmotae TaxID=2663857 RepID=UPI0012B57EF1|nr:MFS transporter [Nocardioides marmotae]MBC9732809.1 MFS transporter [Nocardioides marmotae]MTB83923.1 MFS transporter [Nocardioides marmotae]